MAKEFNIHEQMIIRWCKSYQKFGVDSIKEHRGRSQELRSHKSKIKNIIINGEDLQLGTENEY